jgi:hypothetical protein
MYVALGCYTAIMFGFFVKENMSVSSMIAKTKNVIFLRSAYCF